MMTDILVVEDNLKHAADAREVTSRVAGTYAEFEAEINAKIPDVVLSDLYFPTGYSGKQDIDMREETALMLEGYLKNVEKPNALGKALEFILGSGATGATIEQYLEIMKDDIVIIKYKDHIIRSYEEHQRIKQYKILSSMIRDGSHDAPSGIFVYRECKQRGIPCVVVTSAYHHGIEFQPFVTHVGSYLDQLVEGKKPWKEALDIALRKTR